MADYKTTTLVVATHLSSDNALFGESSVHVKLEDEAAGGFLELQSQGEARDGVALKPGQIYLDLEHLQLIAQVAAEIMAKYEGE